MSDQPENVPGNEPEPYRPIQDWREERRQEREERREARRDRMLSHGGGWIAGIVLILVGLGFLLSNFGLVDFNNWWALFILIPAVGSFSAAWNQYQSAGRLTAGARGSLIGGVILTMVALIFLFELNWALLWPMLLIVGGIGLLLNAVLPS